LHVWQLPVHALSQHTPLAQLPDRQSAPDAHTWPLPKTGFGVQTPPAHVDPLPQTTPHAPQLLLLVATLTTKTLPTLSAWPFCTCVLVEVTMFPAASTERVKVPSGTLSIWKWPFAPVKTLNARPGTKTR
jgi:hypothetical protein